MRKITDDGYVLPVIEALSPHEIFESGANKPLLITGVDREGNKGEYVIKLRAAERMSNEAFLRELLGAFIAAQMDINVISPAIVNISRDFVLLIEPDARQIANKSIGLNFGSLYMTGYFGIPANQCLNNSQLPDAQNIFCFDIALKHPDRNYDKPNLFTNGNEIVIFDHESAFGFIFDFVKDPTPWLIKENELYWIEKHFLLSRIKGQTFDFEDFLSRLIHLNEQFWNAAWHLIPPDWRSDQFGKIKSHFDGLIKNGTVFILELKKLLS